MIPYKENLEKALLEGFHLEWAQQRALFNESSLVSIYFGGGTPSLLQPKSIETLLSLFRQPAEEITLEVNPETVSLEKMAAFRSAGINRISLGVQSLDSKELAVLGREHSAQTAISAIEICAQAGFTNISIDLMFELPGQTVKSWESTLDQVKTLPITHLSLYNLTFEPHTIFCKKEKELRAGLPSQEVRLEMLNMAVNKLESFGLIRYEISAFAKQGYFSRHNTGYWLGRPFLGLGPSAYSYWDKKRFQNICIFSQWLKLLKEGKSPMHFEETLGKEASFRELFAIALRMIDGIDLEQFMQRHGTMPHGLESILQELSQKGWLLYENNHVQLTESGKLFYDSVASEII